MKSETKVCVLLLLAVCFLAKVTADTTVDPAKFVCSKWSPIEDARFSNTDPPVALTHIFCGQIKVKSTGRKKAEGFHSRPKNKDPTCAKATNVHHIANTAYYAEDESILDAKSGEWIARTHPPKYYYFFPSEWDIVTTVNNLIDVYKRCGGSTSTGSSICIRNYVYNGGNAFDVTLFLDQTKRIITAFPEPAGSCKQNCNYPRVRDNEL